MNIILCGYKSCGKTIVAKAYGEAYACDYIDTDHLITETFKKTEGHNYPISKIYHLIGSSSFRQLEESAVSSINISANTIIATGGGTVMNATNVKHLKAIGKIVYLYVDKEILYERLSNADPIPSFIDKHNKEQDLKRYLSSRDTIYQSVSDHVIDASKKNSGDITFMIEQYRHSHGK